MSQRKVEVGQVWTFTDVKSQKAVDLRVALVDSSGAVLFKPASSEDRAAFNQLYPEEPATNKDGTPKTKDGKQLYVRLGPFQFDNDGNPSCHLEWSLWSFMTGPHEN